MTAIGVRRFDSRAEWLAARRIGASDVAAILGVGGAPDSEPHRDGWDVWDRLVNGYVQPDRPEMARGRLWEPVAVAAYQARRPEAEVERLECALATHPEHPWATASPDGLVFDPIAGEIGGLEVKTDASPSRVSWGEEGEIERWSNAAAARVRADYALQAYYQAWVCALPWVDLAVLLPWYDLRIYRIHADPAVFEALKQEIGAWHERHIAQREPPPVSGSERCIAYLGSQFFSGGGADVQAPPDVARWCEEYAAARRAVTAAEAHSEALKAQLLAAAGDADRLLLTADPKGPRITVSRSTRAGAVDLDRLAADHPEVKIETYRKPPTKLVKLLPYKL
jgi:hypothetical protein